MAGAGYKLYSTGDVLTASDVNTYIQQQTVMVFADASARTTALTGVVAEGMLTYLKDTDVVQYYSGSGWVTVNTDQTPLTTKGDLFTYSTQDARLAVGNNGETLVADSSATTGLRWTATPAASNPVLNSSFDIWQRGTSFSSDINKYTADRWMIYRGVTTSTISRQATGDSTNLPNIQYCLRFQRNSGTTSTNTSYLSQSFETVNSIPFAGKTITLSFYGRKGADFSAASSQIQVVLATGTGTDQNVISGAYTGSASPISSTATLTTTWQRFSYTATLSSTLTEMNPYFQWDSVGTAGTNDYVEITGVQIDIGNVALPYRRNSVTLAGELAAAQRYYYRIANGQAYSVFGAGAASSTTVVRVAIPTHVTMRVTPTSIDYANLTIWDYSGAALTPSAYALANLANNPDNPQIDVTVTGATQHRPYYLVANNSANAYFGLSAEL